jgi:dUTP pyrophosphatase
LYSRESTDIAPGEVKKLPSNFIIQVPEGYALIVAARSSLFAKKGLQLTNGIGVIDQDFHGPEDEIAITVINISKAITHVERGERLAQGLLVPIERAQWTEVETLQAPTRGGFGSTGL